MIANVALTGTWLPTDPDTGSNRLLPFEVGPDTARITVRYSVEPLQADTTAKPQLDIGLFDPAGTAFLEANGFRGWSGAFRSEFFVSAEDSTPGYTRGPIAPGTWHVLIGADAQMLGSTGLRYTVDITLTEAAPSEQTGAPAGVQYEPYDPGVQSSKQGWYKGNLHSHTYYSDGHNSIEEMADEHLRLGLQFGALTEHNLLNPDLVKGRRPGFVWLPSEEVTTYRGHMNVWGLSQWLDFRCDNEAAIEAVAAYAHSLGAVTSINHPKDDGPPWLFDFFGTICMEVWQAPWFLSNYQSLAVWDNLLRQGKQIVAVGGSDLHQVGTPENPYSYNLDNPTTWVRANSLSIPGILEGINRGHVFISRDAHGPQVYMSATGGPVPAITGDAVPLAEGDGLTVRVEVLGARGLLLRLVTQQGVVHTAPILTDDFRSEYIWSEAGAQANGYMRAEIIRDMGPELDLQEEPSALWMEAMCNPIYVVRAPDISAAASAEVELETPVSLPVVLPLQGTA